MREILPVLVVMLPMQVGNRRTIYLRLRNLYKKLELYPAIRLEIAIL